MVTTLLGGKTFLQKDEFIQLHTFLLKLRFELEKLMGSNYQELFVDYDKLGIGPQNVSRSKEDHKKPIILSGPSFGAVNVIYNYSAFSIDPENEQLFYL